jgi:hypothetical protein
LTGNSRKHSPTGLILSVSPPCSGWTPRPQSATPRAPGKSWKLRPNSTSPRVHHEPKGQIRL